MTQAGKIYELSYLLSPLIPPGEVAAVVDREVKQKIDELLREDLPKMITLAYPIKKMSEAYFGSLLFRAEPAKIEALKDQCLLSPPFLRLLLVSRRRLPSAKLRLPARPFKPSRLRRPKATKPPARPPTPEELAKQAAIDREIDQLLNVSQ